MSNKKLLLSNPGAAQGVLRPPCLLSGLAAEFHVGQIQEIHTDRLGHDRAGSSRDLTPTTLNHALFISTTSKENIDHERPEGNSFIC